MKPFLSWRDDWLLGLQELDQQHLALAAQLNLIHDVMVREGMRPGCGTEACKHLLDLVEMTREHFHDEEQVMRDCDYPDLTEHHREHVMLLAELQDLIREINNGERQFTLQTLRALKLWQIDHVISSDKGFMEFYSEQLPPEVESSAVIQFQQSA
jgi:hemerythrin-like metal-binding protein